MRMSQRKLRQPRKEGGPAAGTPTKEFVTTSGPSGNEQLTAEEPFAHDSTTQTAKFLAILRPALVRIPADESLSMARPPT